jgi:hypothetical protein
MADYDIFREQMGITFPKYGHALWDPSPRRRGMPVNIGDVGFIRGGKFHRLFSALNPEDDQYESDVQDCYKPQPLVPRFRDHLTESYLDPGQYCSNGVRATPELPQFASRYYLQNSI